MTPTEEARFIALWTAGTATAAMAQQLGIPVGTVGSRAYTLVRQGKIQARPKGGNYPRQKALGRSEAENPSSAHPSTPALHQGYTRPHSGTPAVQDAEAHPGTPHLPAQQPTLVHPSVPETQHTQAHPGVPMPNDLAMRLLALLPELEVIVARERDRQRLVSTPVGTPQHTVKKTYVVETIYVDLVERYAQAEGVERKDVVNLAFHEFFERRQYLPEDRP